MQAQPTLDQLLNERERRKINGELINYVCYSFFKKNKKPFVVNWHHNVICNALEDIYYGRRKNVIFNLPPRYSKTELIVKCFIEWSILKNAKSKFLHLTYTADLALDNSSEIRDNIKSSWFQKHKKVSIRKDSDSKQKWYTSEGGGMYATGTCGAITGFGAGHFDSGEDDLITNDIDDWITKDDDGEVQSNDEFGGAIIIDDPIKPEDANSELQRNKANSRLNTTILSRRNSANKTPIIIVMQRLHENDMTGFCINGGTSEKFDVISIPAENDDGEALWPMKHTIEQLRDLEKADPFMYASQYKQNPKPMEGGLIPETDWRRYEEVPMNVLRKIQVWDCAQKPGITNDYSVCATWIETPIGYYLIDVWRGKLTAPKLQDKCEELYAEHLPDAVIIEDKSAGSSLIQYLQESTKIPVVPYMPDVDKVQRALRVTPTIKSGNCHIPKFTEWTKAFIEEHERFPYAKHDDQVDTTSMAIDYFKKNVISTRPRIRQL